MADPERASSRDHPLRNLQEHVLPLLTGIGGSITVLVGVGYEAFYSRLGVRPAEIALGARDIVIHGALGLVLLLALNGLLIATVVFAVIGWRMTWGRPRQTSRQSPDGARSSPAGGNAGERVSVRQRLVSIAVLACILAAAVLAFTVPAFSTVLFAGLLLLVVAGGILRVLWSTSEHDDIGVSFLARVIAVSIGLLAGLHLVAAGAAIVVVQVDDSADGRELVATFAGLLLIAVGLLVVRRMLPLYSLPRLIAASSGALTRATYIGAVVLLTVQVSTIAWDTRVALDRLVVDGDFRPGRYSPLLSAPITCVETHWLPGDAPTWLPDTSLHLGAANGTVVLFTPQQGAYRLPSSSVALAPSASC